MDISTVEVEKTRTAARASLVDSTNFDVPMGTVALTQHLSAIIKMIVEIIPTRLPAVSVPSLVSFLKLFLLFFKIKISRHVTEANLDVPMPFVYPRTSTAMDITIVPTRVTKLIARQSRVPTTNFYARMAVQIECQSV